MREGPTAAEHELGEPRGTLTRVLGSRRILTEQTDDTENPQGFQAEGRVCLFPGHGGGGSCSPQSQGSGEPVVPARGLSAEQGQAAPSSPGTVLPTLRERRYSLLGTPGPRIPPPTPAWCPSRQALRTWERRQGSSRLALP